MYSRLFSVFAGATAVAAMQDATRARRNYEEAMHRLGYVKVTDPAYLKRAEPLPTATGGGLRPQHADDDFDKWVKTRETAVRELPYNCSLR